MKTEVLSGRGAWQEADRRYRVGHKEYICWQEGETPFAARLTRHTMKRALLAHGTRRMNHDFPQEMYRPDFGLFGWQIGLQIWNQLKKEQR